MQTKTNRTLLSPTQNLALVVLRRALEAGSIASLSSEPGCGKTTVLRQLHHQTGGAFLSIADLVDASSKRHQLSLEEMFFDVVLSALRRHPTCRAPSPSAPSAPPFNAPRRRIMSVWSRPG